MTLLFGSCPAHRGRINDGLDDEALAKIRAEILKAAPLMTPERLRAGLDEIAEVLEDCKDMKLIVLDSWPLDVVG
jgi:hypothetical protein